MDDTEEVTDLDDAFVGHLMSADVTTVTPETLVESAAQTMLDHDIGSLVVVDDDDRIEGILTTTDFVRIVSERNPKDETPVERYMSTGVVTTTVNATVREAADKMVEEGVHHLPVADGDQAVGILTTTDLASYLSHVGAPGLPGQ